MYFDLIKSYNIIDHNILLTKLEYYGIWDLLLAWEKIFTECKIICKIVNLFVNKVHSYDIFLLFIYLTVTKKSCPF